MSDILVGKARIIINKIKNEERGALWKQILEKLLKQSV